MLGFMVSNISRISISCSHEDMSNTVDPKSRIVGLGVGDVSTHPGKHVNRGFSISTVTNCYLKENNSIYIFGHTRFNITIANNLTNVYEMVLVLPNTPKRVLG